MKFNSTASPENSLYHDVRSILGISLLESTTLPVATFVRSANSHYQLLALRAWRASSQWNFDDSNASTLPEATTTLVAGQEDYALPATALDVIRVQVKDDAGDWCVVDAINPNEIDQALDEFYETDGLPKYWYRNANSLILKPAPAEADCTLASGLKIFVSREVTAFSTTSTSTEPGLPDAFHRVISIGAALDFARSSGMVEHYKMWQPEYDKLLGQFDDYYAKRSKIKRPSLNRRRINTV